MNFPNVLHVLVFLVVVLTGCLGSATEEDTRSAIEAARDVLKNDINKGDYVIGRNGRIFGVSRLHMDTSGSGKIMMVLHTRSETGHGRRVWLSEDLKTGTREDFLYKYQLVRIVRKNDPEYPEIAALFTSFQRMKKRE